MVPVALPAFAARSRDFFWLPIWAPASDRPRMDLLTQGLLGAAVATAAAPREETRRAMAVGFMAGLLPDADILIQSAEDPLLNLDYHRHFTHALAFLPAGASIAAAVTWPFVRKGMSFARVLRYAFLGILLAGALDACTGYGTFLFWPFSDTRVALHLISIVDPIFTGMLAVACGLSLYRRRTTFVRTALVCCCAYLVLAFVQQQRAADVARMLAGEREETVRRLIARPSFGNILLWKTLYRTNDRVRVDAVRAGWDTPRIYEGESVPLFQGDDDARARGIAADSVLFKDIRRFAKFSDGWIGVHPQRPDLLGDFRYSMLPHRALPLWGIVLDPERQDEHAEFRSFRKLSREERGLFFQMLAGRP